MDFKKDDIVIYPQHGACKVKGVKKLDFFGKKESYLILETVINEMTLRVPVAKLDEVGVRPPVNPDELEDLVAVLSKADPRVPANWSRRFKNHQEKLKSGDVYQVAEVVRNLAARNRDASLSAAERTMYDRARVNLISEIAPALKVSKEEAEEFLNLALERGVLKPAKAAKKSATPAPAAAKKAPDVAPAVKKGAAKKTAEKKPAEKKSAVKKSAAEKTPAAKKTAAKKS
jgi:CarD family transcriptional regulator